MASPALRRCERGGAALEFALTVPLLLLLLLGALKLGRAVVTRERLADAVGYATRAAAVAGETNRAAIHQAVQTRLGAELKRCSSLQVQSSVVPGAFAGGRALLVEATCALTADTTGLVAAIGPSGVTVSAAFPL